MRWRRRRAAGRARDHQSAGDGGAVGPPHPPVRSRRPSSGRIAAPASAAASSGRPASRRCSAGAPGWSPIPTSRPPSSSGCSAIPSCVAARQRGARRGDGGKLAGGEAHRRAGSRERSHQREPHAALRSRLARLASRAARHFRGTAEVLPALVTSSSEVIGETDPHTGVRLPIAGLAGTSSRRSSGRGCWPKGWPRTPTAPARSCWCIAAPVCRSRPAGVLATAACGPRGEPAYALEGERVHRGRRGPVAARWSSDHRERAGERRLARSVASTEGVTFVPAFVGLGTPHWEPEARGPSGAHPRQLACAPGARGAGGDRIQLRRPAERHDRDGRARRPGAAGGRRRCGERLDDAVPGRRARRAGGAARHGGDDGARRRGARRAGTRRVEEPASSSPAAGSPDSPRRWIRRSGEDACGSGSGRFGRRSPGRAKAGNGSPHTASDFSCGRRSVTREAAATSSTSRTFRSSASGPNGLGRNVALDRAGRREPPSCRCIRTCRAPAGPGRWAARIFARSGPLISGSITSVTSRSTGTPRSPTSATASPGLAAASTV